MRVTHVITRLIVGGAQENTIASVLGLHRIPGIDVELLAGPTTGPEGSLESEFLAAGRAFQSERARLASTADGGCGGERPAAAPSLTIFPELVRPIHPWHDFRTLRQLTLHFRGRRPDIVHTHSGKAGVLGRLAAARAGVPIIVHTVHGPSFGAFQGHLANLLFRAVEQYAARVTTHFVSVADAMTQQYLAAGIGRREQFTRIFSGFPLEPYLAAQNDLDFRASLGLSPDDIVIGKIARLFPLKGHETLFAIAPTLVAACPQIKFLLVGDGVWRGHFERMARASGLHNHFIFTGLVPPQEIPALLGIMDLVVHLSEREGLPRALPQALAAGRPVVAFDCDGAREVCRDGDTGFLVRPGHTHGLIERLLLLVRDVKLRSELAARGREFVRANFAVELMIANLHRLYLKLAAGRGPGPT